MNKTYSTLVNSLRDVIVNQIEKLVKEQENPYVFNIEDHEEIQYPMFVGNPGENNLYPIVMKVYHDARIHQTMVTLMNGDNCKSNVPIRDVTFSTDDLANILDGMNALDAASINYEPKFRKLRELCIKTIIRIVLEKGEKNKKGRTELKLDCNGERPEIVIRDESPGTITGLIGYITALETIEGVDYDLHVKTNYDCGAEICFLQELTTDEIVILNACIAEL